MKPPLDHTTSPCADHHARPPPLLPLDSSPRVPPPDPPPIPPLSPRRYHDPVHESRDYVYGAVASLVNISLTFPINKVMFRQQLYGVRLFKAFRQIRTEGMRTLFRGLAPPLMQRTVTVSLMFGTYTNFRGTLRDHFPSMPYPVVHVAAAMCAGTTEAIFAPFERVQVILQDAAYHDRLQNTFHTFRVIHSYGIRELYRGTSLILIRNGPSNVLFLGLREPLVRCLPEPESEFGQMFNTFLCGAALGAFLSTCFFPLNVVKNRMQTQLGEPYLGIRATYEMICEERRYKWRKLFRGVHVNYTRSFISWGIINATYEFMKRHFG